MGVVEVKLAKRAAQLELSPEDPLSMLSALVTHLRVDWPNDVEEEIGDLTLAPGELSAEEAGLESVFLGAHTHMTSAIFFYPLLSPFSYFK